MPGCSAILTAAASEDGRLRLLMRSNVKSIEERSVTLDQDGELRTLDNDAIIVNAGGILPTGFLKKTGIDVETKFGTA